MARMASILIPSQDTYHKSGLVTANTDTVQVPGKYRIMVITAIGTGTTPPGINIAFGSSAGKVAAATSDSYLVPFNQQTTFDLGSSLDEFQVMNNSGANCDYYVMYLAVQ